MRIHELGKELGVENKIIIEFLTKEGAEVKNHMSAIPENLLEKTRTEMKKRAAGRREKKPEVKAVAVPDFIGGEIKKKDSETDKKEGKESKEKADASADKTDKREKGDAQEKKKKIVSVFNPQHSTSGPAKSQDRHERTPHKPQPAQTRTPQAARPSQPQTPHIPQEAEKKPVIQRPVKRIPARDRKPDDELIPTPRPISITNEKKPAASETVQTAAKAPEKKPAEPEAVKSLRDKIVKGTVSITDIPIRPAKTETQEKRQPKDRRNQNRDNNNNNRPQHSKDGKDFSKDQRNNQQRPARPADKSQPQTGAAPAAGGDRAAKGKRGKFDKDSRKDKFDRLENEKAAQKIVKQAVKEEPKEEIKVITLPETISIKDFATKLKMQPSALIKKLFMQGKVYTVNDFLDFETAEEIALEFDIISEHEVVVDYIEELLKEEEDLPETLKKRPPVVCVMGHVDHGKTSLLDAIRKTNVIQGEAGGITQHIGAYTVEINGESITFLDTPGHEAFTAMRLRGAQATDVAILVVAADDGVMPQTVEAINHAKAANIRVIVAVNKIDKPGANIPKVMQELSDLDLVPEEWGGDTIFVPISAKTGEGIENLLEMVILGTEILELKANPDRMARGIVIEAKLDKGRGTVATLLVQKGTLKVGDHIAMGEAYGKVRAMTDDKGQKLKIAGPSKPVEITGLSGVPNAGEVFVAFDNDKDAKHFASVYIEENKKKLLAGTKAKMSLDDVFDQMKTGDLKELDIIIKADVQGSAEAMKESLEKLSNDEVIVKVIHSAVGNVSESDAVLASASNAIIIAFNVGVNADAKMTIDHEKVDLRSYKVIYNAIDDVELAMKGMLEPVYEEAVTGHVEVRQTFKASGVGIIAGSYVTDGVVKRDSKIRLSRDGEMIYEGSVASLKRFNDDAKEVKSGFECGIVLENFSDIKEGDIMEAYEMKEVSRL